MRAALLALRVGGAQVIEGDADALLVSARRAVRRMDDHGFGLPLRKHATKRAGLEIAGDIPVEEVFVAMTAQIMAQIPLGRTATSDEVAHWIVALADPAATWLTGQVLGIDGGFRIS